MEIEAAPHAFSSSTCGAVFSEDRSGYLPYIREIFPNPVLLCYPTLCASSSSCRRQVCHPQEVFLHTILHVVVTKVLAGFDSFLGVFHVNVVFDIPPPVF